MTCLIRRFGLIALICLVPTASGGVLFNAGSDWKWRKGTSEASSPDTTLWQRATFNDSGWDSGASPFFYGENLPPGTLITDMRNSYSSIYLRKRFTVTGLDQIAAIDLDVRCDDGFIAWVNGQKIASKNQPATVAYNSFATLAANEPAGFQTYRVEFPGNLLLEGENLIAIQLFNVSLTSSDLLFDAQLFTTEKETDPPTIIAVSPFPSTVTNLTELTVTFGEPVQGVDATDLRVNDRAAQSVTGSGAVYTFQFQQPEFGSVQVSWSPDANIQDQALPPNAFDPNGASSRFLYDLVDPSFPLVSFVHPPIGAEVRQLSEIEIYFTKPVQGVEAPDLLINGQPASTMIGTGAGPYLFQFPELADGTVSVEWDAGHQIVDYSPTPKVFEGTPWTYSVQSSAPVPAVRINEISAANMTGLRDQDGSAEDWIELHNPGEESVNLAGWSLTDDPAEPGKWVMPPVSVPAGGYLVVFASGKDRKTIGVDRPHTNFKLSLAGEYLGLFTPDSPRLAASELAPAFPEQRNDISYGQTANGSRKYFSSPTPGQPNGTGGISGVVAPVEFTVKRGFFQSSFQLGLYCPTPGVEIRYTFDGTEPTETSGIPYTNLVRIDRTRTVRAAAFKPGNLPSLTETHTYFFNLPYNRRLLPALSLVTASNNLYGSTGIMEVNPRNTIYHGMAWERPISVEYIRPQDNEGFQIDCGIRIQGGGYVRERYDYRTGQLPFSKYSFRLYFRGDYGAGKLDYPLFPGIPLDSFDEVVLRAGMNDHSNPFIRDELARALSADVGCVASHGTFVNLFLNGVYKGVYNPTERIGWKFLHQWHGGGEDWDLIAQSSEIREGDAVAWNGLLSIVNTRSPAITANYLEIAKRMDVTNFIDYLLAHIYADTDDWPHNNWRAARERTPEGRFRFYIWDAEWSFGYNNSVAHNTIANQLSSLSPPWGSTEIQRLFTRLQLSPEFRLLWADRVHKHFFNGGALTDERIRARYEQIRDQVAPSITGFDHTIGNSWIPQRRRYVTNHFAQAGLLASATAPVFSQFGGRVAQGFELEVTAASGTVYYTTNGVDPRIPFSGDPHQTAIAYTGPVPLEGSVQIKARTLADGQWSAVTEAGFEMERLGSPLRITEIMYHALGGDEFEFVELQNTGGSPLDLGSISISGIDFRFPEGGPLLEGGGRIVIASSLNPALFAQRYPGVVVGGYYQGTLSNGGELIALKDSQGNILSQVMYDDENGWPLTADGNGYSLELIDVEGHPNVLANWQASSGVDGSPGAPNSAKADPAVRLSEVMAENLSAVPYEGGFPDWIELENASDQTVDLTGWGLSDDSNPRKFVFPAGTILPPDGRIVVWCSPGGTGAGHLANFALSRTGETASLYDAAGHRVDAVSWGMQIADYSIGRAEGGDWELNEPSPGAENQTVAVAGVEGVRLNELSANSLPGEPDWVELHNLNAQMPAALGHAYLATDHAVSQIEPLSFIPAGGYTTFFADKLTGPGHLSFNLAAIGERLAWHDQRGTEIDQVSYAAQLEGESHGRLPNGTGSWTTFSTSVSPGAANYRPDYDGPVINELLARNASGLDWIELQNPTAAEFDLSGMSLSLNRRKAGEWTFAAGTVIPAGGFLVLNCNPLLADGGIISSNLAIGPGLNGESGGVYFFNAGGQLVDSVEYGSQVADYSIGRTGTGWALLGSATPGSGNSQAETLGSINDLMINEWMAAPIIGDDWFELYNPGALPVELSGLYVTDDPSLYGRTNTTLPDLAFIGAGGFVLLQADGETDQGRDHAAFSLSSLGETIRLYSPAFFTLDEVNFAPQMPGVSEGRVPDGGSNFAAFPGSATPGSSNIVPSNDSDGDGMPDDWEDLHGLNASVPDGDTDLDGDGISNFEEFQAGTDPSDASSTLALTATAEAASGAVVLHFTAAAGRSYTIFYKEELGWVGWNRLANIEAAAEMRAVQIEDAGTDAARFYRIVTPLQP